LATGKEALRIPVQKRLPIHLAFSPDGTAIAVADMSDTIRIFETSGGKTIRELRRDGVQFLKTIFAPDGRSLAAFANAPPQSPIENPVRIWDLRSGEERTQIRGADVMSSAAFAP